jgi:histidinol-phosphatase (PHP family)
MDMVQGRENEIRKIIEDSGFDYVIGSVHYLEGWPFDQEKYRHVFEQGNLKEIYNLFFDTIIRAAETGLYDIAGHVDNIKRMGYRLSGDMSEYYERAAKVFRDRDLTVELNTAGLDTAAKEPYPSLQFLRVLNRYNFPVPLGSDSHHPEQVGRHFTLACGILRESGYDQVAYFHERKRILKPLPDATDCGGIP